MSRRSTPRFKRKPKKKHSSNAAASVTTVRSCAAPATYFSSESGLAKRMDTTPAEDDASIECASTPKPRYGGDVQYLRLWRDSKPARMKFEISYFCPPAVYSFSQAAR